MIIVNLVGGLGNQMFQYACGLALSSTTGENVLYATDIYDQQATYNGYELDTVFGLALPIATPPDRKRALGFIGSNPYVRRAVMNYALLEVLMPGTAIFERSFAFDANLAVKLSKGGYLHGYWQSESYFGNTKEQVYRAFQFKGVDDSALDVTGKINVSLHVRRGDYMNAGKVLAVCNDAYYKNALGALGLSLEETILNVFSDDPNWARQHISNLHPECRFIQGNHGKNSYKDMYLMSKCDHHIIANSSFSWWGAWLNQSPGKRVIAPKRWFVDPAKKSDNIIPPNWEFV
jgi:Glycosyl transferase family 11